MSSNGFTESKVKQRQRNPSAPAQEDATRTRKNRKSDSLLLARCNSRIPISPKSKVLPSLGRIQLDIPHFVQIAVVGPRAKGDFVRGVGIVRGDIGEDGNLLDDEESGSLAGFKSAGSVRWRVTLIEVFFENWMLMRCGWGPSLLSTTGPAVSDEIREREREE